jgi:prepilin signal peptidase PulO-like enzyme (type II secretory pathway)
MLLFGSFYLKASVFWYLIVFLAGLVMGSFINSFVWRAYEDKKFFFQKSCCIHCGEKLLWYENIPLFSFLFLKGKCRNCQKRIPIHYFLVEIGVALVFLLRFHSYILSDQISFWLIYRDVFFILILSVIFIYDFLYKLVYVPVVWLGFFLAIFFNYKIFFGAPHVGLKYLAGIVVGFVFFGFQWIISSHKWIGVGDIYMGVLMGMWLGFEAILLALLLAYVGAAVYGLFQILFKKKKWNSEIPLASFLSLATFVVYYYGEKLLSFIL